MKKLLVMLAVVCLVAAVPRSLDMETSFVPLPDCNVQGTGCAKNQYCESENGEAWCISEDDPLPDPPAACGDDNRDGCFCCIPGH